MQKKSETRGVAHLSRQKALSLISIHTAPKHMKEEVCMATDLWAEKSIEQVILLPCCI